MSMLITFAAIKKTLDRPSSAYAAARGRHAVLAAYETPAAVHAALARASSLSPEERHAVIDALVEENQRTPDPIWQALLLAAFEPILVYLRGRIGPRSDEDLDQDLLVAFLAAIRAVRVGVYTTLAIRWATEAPLFAARRKERRAPQFVEFDEEQHACSPFGPPADEQVAVVQVVRIIESRGGPELLQAMLATHGTDESLKDYVARNHEHLSEKERASIYERLKRARRDVLEKLNAQLARVAA